MSASKAAAMLRIMGTEDPRFVAWVVEKIDRGAQPETSTAPDSASGLVGSADE